MKIAIFLPAKGTSSRIKSKNLELMDGKPLFLHTLEKIYFANCFDEVWLDTESNEVIDAANHLSKIHILKRDKNLADNRTDGHRLFLNEVNHTQADIIIQILGTSPFIEIETINKAIDILKNDTKYDSVVMVNEQKIYTWSDGRPDYNLYNIPNSGDLEGTIIETMGLYVVRRDAALKTGRRIGERPYLLNCKPIEAIDVNWPEDFELANKIAAGLREEDRKLLNNIKTHLSSPMLSDIMDDLGVSEKQLLLGLNPNIKGAKIFGRAKTLKLRAMKEGEDYKGIYEALNSYATVIPNDVILVENETPDYAYFGELNANLAVRCGAAGAIIGGKTRDNNQVISLNFPTFSKGYVARDVRKRAVMESMNQPINIFGTPISPGDLVFADEEGIVVIPREMEKEILKEVFKRLNIERNILLDIASGAPVNSLTSKHGDF